MQSRYFGARYLTQILKEVITLDKIIKRNNLLLDINAACQISICAVKIN
jgi:hypothetical protein